MMSAAESETLAPPSAAEETLRPSRDRKQVQRMVAAAEAPKERTLEIPEGTGVALGDYEFFASSFEKLRTDDEVCKTLHVLLFNAPGAKNDRKKNIRKFSGYANTDNLNEKVSKILDKKAFTVSMVKSLLALFGCERSGTREELVKRLVDFVQSPHVMKSGSSSSSGKRKSTSSKGKKAKKAKKGSKADKPKRAPSAFLLFSQANRAQVKEANPEATFGEMGKLLGDMWGALDAEGKHEWTVKAATAKALVDNSHVDGGEDDEEALAFSEGEESDADGGGDGDEDEEGEASGNEEEEQEDGN